MPHPFLNHDFRWYGRSHFAWKHWPSEYQGAIVSKTCMNQRENSDKHIGDIPHICSRDNVFSSWEHTISSMSSFIYLFWNKIKYFKLFMSLWKKVYISLIISLFNMTKFSFVMLSSTKVSLGSRKMSKDHSFVGSPRISLWTSMDNFTHFKWNWFSPQLQIMEMSYMSLLESQREQIMPRPRDMNALITQYVQ